jgi:hypothetical protein
MAQGITTSIASSIRQSRLLAHQQISSRTDFKVGSTIESRGKDANTKFTAWRKLLKDLITYFREIQASYEQRSKSLLKVSNVINNINAPTLFITDGGLSDATRILRDHHKHAVAEANKARDIENDVITQLNGLRSDLNQKIKEIKSLSGDFKNSVEKEKENTRRAVNALEEAIVASDQDPAASSGKGDPFVVRLGVDRQVEKQIDEENYLHRVSLKGRAAAHA